MFLQLRIFKNTVGAGSEGEWSNSYDLIAGAALDSVTISNQVQNIVLKEQNAHTDSIQFQRAVLSKVLQPGELRLPTDLRVIPLNLIGKKVLADGSDAKQNALPLNMALAMTHGSTLGRQGRNYYRGVVSGTDWENRNNVPTITGGAMSDFLNEMATVVHQTGAGGTGSDLDSMDWVIFHKDKDTGVVTFREVDVLGLAGIVGRDRRSRRRKKSVAAGGAGGV